MDHYQKIKKLKEHKIFLENRNLASLRWSTLYMAYTLTLLIYHLTLYSLFVVHIPYTSYVPYIFSFTSHKCIYSIHVTSYQKFRFTILFV